MRFFLEFVSCCGTTTQRTAVQTTTAEEEERSLVPTFSLTRRQRKRGKLGATAAAATPEWRPSLGAISEDNIVPPRARSDGVRNGKFGPEREVCKRSAAAGAAAKVHHRNYGDNHK